MSEDRLRFPSHFQHEFTFGHRAGNKGYFGVDVLRGLIAGIDEFLEDPEHRWRQYRSMGPALLGCVPWLDDPALLDKIMTLPSACVVVTKQELKKRGSEKFEALKRHAQDGAGFPAEVFAELTHLTSRHDGPPSVLGPYSPRPDDLRIQPIRSFGYRKTGGRLVPLIHAKMFLLGHLWWHDEDGSPAGVADVTGFTPKRLWLGSANGTKSSRLSLEFGVWLEDPELLAAAQRFIVQLMRSSEGIDPDDDLFEPEFVNVEYDDEAFAEALHDLYDSFPDADS
jgi:hypothetical protein